MSTWEFPLMRKAGSLLAEVSVLLHERAVTGATPLELDALAEAEILKRKCRPAFKGYRGFPKTLCISVNEQVIHGIPNNRPFQEGDVVSVDMGLSYGGYFADMAFTKVLGENEEGRRLARATKEALAAGIAAAKPGNRIGDIGAAIQGVAERNGLGVVRSYAGHGIGRALHENPSVPNFGRPGQGTLLKPGMALAIEPMFTLGSDETAVLPDNWTVVTVDGSLAAHAERTVLLTENGVEVLTLAA